MRKILFVATLLLASAPAAAQVDVGRVKWDKLPELRAVTRPLPTPEMVKQVEQILGSGECSLPGQSADQFDITVPYAVLVEPDGKAKRVVVGEMQCPPLETYVGRLVLTFAAEGDFHPTGKDKADWYASRINFNLR